MNECLKLHKILKAHSGSKGLSNTKIFKGVKVVQSVQSSIDSIPAQNFDDASNNEIDFNVIEDNAYPSTSKITDRETSGRNHSSQAVARTITIEEFEKCTKDIHIKNNQKLKEMQNVIDTTSKELDYQKQIATVTQDKLDSK